MLSFLEKIEDGYSRIADPRVHGFEAPMRLTSVSASDPNRLYGLRAPVRAAFNEIGVLQIDNPEGFITGIS